MEWPLRCRLCSSVEGNQATLAVVARRLSMEWPLTLAARAQSKRGGKRRAIMSSDGGGGKRTATAYLRLTGVAAPACCAALLTFAKTPMRRHGCRTSQPPQRPLNAGPLSCLLDAWIDCGEEASQATQHRPEIRRGRTSASFLNCRRAHGSTLMLLVQGRSVHRLSSGRVDVVVCHCAGVSRHGEQHSTISAPAVHSQWVRLWKVSLLYVYWVSFAKAT